MSLVLCAALLTKHSPSFLQTFWIHYMDEVASLIGVKPDWWRLAWRDPGLAFWCYFGPCLPAQYRLHGPGASPGAPNAIRSRSHFPWDHRIDTLMV